MFSLYQLPSYDTMAGTKPQNNSTSNLVKPSQTTLTVLEAMLCLFIYFETMHNLGDSPVTPFYDTNELNHLGIFSCEKQLNVSAQFSFGSLTVGFYICSY